ncbi:MAG TPA: hypothetical protein VE076_02905 [Nitrososphaeraceae archaeon]|nr:hypothetical protein [Nitrososphaeraceae archaeon]
MFNKQTNLLLGILLSTMISSSFLAISDQISEKALAQSKAGSNNMTGGAENASAMMVNKTVANSDVLMTKVRNMGNSSAIAGSNMTTQG